MWFRVALVSFIFLCLLFHLEMASAALPGWYRAVIARSLGLAVHSPVEEQKEINTLADQLCNRNYSFSILCVHIMNQTQLASRTETQERNVLINLTVNPLASTLPSATGSQQSKKLTTSLPVTPPLIKPTTKSTQLLPLTLTQTSKWSTTAVPSSARSPQPSPHVASTTGKQPLASLAYSELPQSYVSAFMTVDQLVGNANLTVAPGPNSGNTLVVFSNQTRRDFDDDVLRAVDSILTAIVPGTYRTITYTNGCCALLRFFAANETMKNINGVEKRLVHFSTSTPPRHQFIQHGFCVQSSYSTNGHCIQGWVTMSLLVYDLDLYPPITFDIFNVPSFCNCVHY